jgi:hypothetical protein
MPAWFSSVYGAVLHIGALVALTVLVASGKLDVATGLPLIGGLVGFGAGVAVSPTGSTVTTTAKTAVPAAPAVVEAPIGPH